MKTKAFSGKDTKSEERAEAREVKSGKVSPAKYATLEKKEGERGNLKARGEKLKSGKLSATTYANNAKPR